MSVVYTQWGVPSGALVFAFTFWDVSPGTVAQLVRAPL